MPGIGKYTKGKKFQLRSGNTPSGFKMMGSSNKNDATSTASDADVITDNNNEEPKVNKFSTIANKVGNTLVGAFTSGLDAVYGRGKVIPGNKVKFHDPKDKDNKEEKTGQDKVNEQMSS